MNDCLFHPIYIFFITWKDEGKRTCFAAELIRLICRRCFISLDVVEVPIDTSQHPSDIKEASYCFVLLGTPKYKCTSLSQWLITLDHLIKNTFKMRIVCLTFFFNGNSFDSFQVYNLTPQCRFYIPNLI